MRKLSLIWVLTSTMALLSAHAQNGAPRSNDSGIESGGSVERGKYIVEHLAMCELCHTPRDEHGNADRRRWLKGGPVQLRPAYAATDWAVVAPPIAGDPPGTEQDFIRLLTTGIARTGSPPRPPMPVFDMSRADAEAVLAYLKSLGR